MFTYLFQPDWLHCTDQGVASDFLGNEFEYLVSHKMSGSNKGERCRALNGELLEFYRTHAIKDRIPELLPKTYESSKSTRPPKLKGNAASVRAMVKFGNLMAQKYLSHTDPIEKAIMTAAHHLDNCYGALSSAHFAWAHAALYQSSNFFAVQYEALWTAFGQGPKWRPMPKMHLFLELCAADKEPAKSWCYRDEDFGGSVARWSKMRGRWKKISAFCRHALDMFRMKNAAPRIVEANSTCE